MIYDTNGIAMDFKKSIIAAIDELPLPTRWNGFDLIWKIEPQVEMVHIGAVVAGHLNGHLFGLRYDLSWVLAGGQDLSPGFFVEYRLIGEIEGETRVWRLLQRESIFFSNLDDKFDAVTGSSLPRAQKDMLGEIPVSLLEDVSWPVFNGELMELASRFTLPDSKFCRENFVWDKEIFIFVDSKERWRCICLLGVDQGQQSSTSHYEQERWDES